MSRTIDIEAIEAASEKDSVRFRPLGEKLDSWGVNSTKRTFHSRNKQHSSRIRKDVRKLVEGDRYLSA